MADNIALNQTYKLLGHNTSIVNQTLAANTKEKHPSLFQEPHGVRVIRLVFQTLMFLVGVLGNLLVCFVTSRKRGQTSTGNLFILYLAIADLGILLVDFPFVVVRSEFPYSWPFGRFMCRTIYPFLDIFYGVQIGCITAIAFHRYKMLVHCTKPQITLDQAKKIVFIIWFVSFIFIVAPLLFVMDLDVKPWRRDCRPHWPNMLSLQLFSVISALMFYVIPLTVILITYVKIRTLLRNNTKRQESYQGSSFREGSAFRKQFKARASQNRRAVQILTPVVVIFALTMLPFTIFRFVAAYDPNILQTFKYVRLVFNICIVLLMVNSSVNPIIYSVINSEFRRDFSNHLRCNADSCCSDTGENLTTVHRTSYPNHHNINRRDSAPLLGQHEFLWQNGNLKKNRHRGSLRSLDSALKDMESSSHSNNQILLDKKKEDLEPMKGVLLIKVNPTYETGGF
ncbi:galanin receptor type 1-like [Actinia tenebrosa]|uniref:Galanin receptor type 1-like n=1 Tax=Actinia tenebrosa TaxID=6105 RepID=A0A6P8GXY0_ACTTE|nr:galanin receptor type 1-like [Actinia tenebrosa]